MRILFMDESGTPRKPGPEYPKYFVVGGIVVPEALWHTLKDGLNGLKIRFGIRGEIKWRYFAPVNDDLKNPMRQMSADQRNLVREAVYKLICNHKAIVTIANVVSHDAAFLMPSVNSQSDVYHLGYKGVTERFQYHLQDLSRAAGRTEYGIVVSDHRGNSDDKILRQVHQKLLHSKGEFISNYQNLIEGLFLEPSHLSIGIQLADMVAGAVWRKFERNDDFWFQQLAPSLRKGSNGNVNGFGIIKSPKQGWK